MTLSKDIMKERLVGRYVLAYLFWLISFGLSILLVLLIIDTGVYAMAAAEWNYYAVRLVRQFLIIVSGLCALVLLIWNEHYFRTGVQRNWLLERFARICGILLLFMGLMHVIQILISMLFGGLPDVILVGLGVAELGVGLGAFRYAKRTAEERKTYKGRL